MKGIAFLAQNLDNISTDYIEFEGRSLPPDDPQRQEITGWVSEVSLKGERKIEGDGFALYVLGGEFVIRAIPQQKDNVGRFAPVLCYGRFPTPPSDEWLVNLARDFARFIKGINRNFRDGMENEISSVVRQEMSNAGVKKNLLAVIAIMLLTLLIAYGIYIAIFQTR